MARSKQSASSRASSKSSRSTHSKSKGSASRSNGKGGILDARSRRDIAAVACSVGGIALLIIACAPADGLVSGYLSLGLHLLFGIGCYILPVFLLLTAAVMFIRTDEAGIPARVGLGLALLFLSLLIMLALYTPGITADTLENIFLPVNLRYQGGYAGAIFGYVLYLLLGRAVATVVVVGLIVISLIVIGFSISGMVDKLREKREIRAERKAERESAPAQPCAPYGQGNFDETQVQFAPLDFYGDPDETIAYSADVDPDLTQRLVPQDPDRTIAYDAIRPAKKPHRAKTSIADRAGESETIAFADEQGSRAMTRRLGEKHRSDVLAASAEAAASAASAAIGEPRQASAMPHPSENFELPSMDLLRTSVSNGESAETEEALQRTATKLQETLADFGVNAHVVDWVAGPTVTLFKIDLPAGVRVSRVKGLADDIALALAARGVRIFSPVPGTNYVGIEVPNSNRQNVLLGDVLPSASSGPLQIAIGKDVEGRNIVTDLSKMPHLLIGGTTGSGKSVSINAMIMSILMRATPAEVRFIMIDPKRVEFTPYNGIPHLYVPVVTECREAASALSWAVAEMERRLKVFSKAGARNIGQYNAKAQESGQSGEPGDREMPYMVIVIDELADLMMNVGKDVEMSISRLAQLARAAGIHMIVATQRPSTNVVTGLIKANITNRIAFNVASGIDSRVILDQTGAENLIGLGDMLMSKPEYQKPQRLQGCYVSEEEINAVVEKLKEQGEPEYHSEILQTNVMQMGSTAPDGSGGRGSGDDPLVWEAAEIIVSSGLGSTSNIQRRLSVGYSRAGRIMDMLEEKGIVGPPNGSKPREVLVDELELETIKAFDAADSE